MRLYALPFSVSAAAYFILGLWVIVRQRSRAQRLYGFLCITTCLWQATWAIVFAHLSPEQSTFWIRVCFTGIVFIPAVFYHFIVEFTSPGTESNPLLVTYLFSTLLAVSVWIDGIFLHGFYANPWGLAPRAGRLHPLFALVISAVIVRILVLIRRFQKRADITELKRRQSKWVMAATLCYCGGALDILANYGLPIFPLSFLFLGTAIVLFGYAILRYEFLAMAAPSESGDELRRREAASNEMNRLAMTAAFPLVSQGELLGYLLLGEKMSEESYSKEDLLLLRIIANQAALAYQRVRYLEMAVHGARTEMLGEIAGGFAHEIKTPLANISLPAELTLMELADLEKGETKLEDALPELKARMKDIMQQAFKASEKIEAIRQFSKPGQVKLEPVELGRILENSLALLDHLLRKTNVKVKTEFPAVMPQIRGDAKQLEIVFVNLIKNAAEAMAHQPSPGLARELLLRGREEGEWVVASVKDSGPGIRRTDVGHLFEAYFSTKGSEGTGVGLFLSRQVIKAHGGSIDVKSEEGQGTEFIIRLPKYVAQNHHAAA